MSSTTIKEALSDIELMAQRLRGVNNLTDEQKENVWQAFKLLESVENDIFL